MAHNLATVDGKVSMAYNRMNGAPWHGLGQDVIGLMTSEEALDKAGLNFKAEKKEMFTQIGTDIIPIPDAYAVVRSDNNAILGTVGAQYSPIQNTDAFKFFDDLVSEKQAMYETCGALGVGEKIWIMAKLPDDIIVKADKVETYLLLSNSHNGTTALTAQFTPVRVVCQNTLNLALKGATHKIKIRHSQNAQARLEMAHELLGITKKVYKHTNELFTAMSEKFVTPTDVRAYLDGVFKVKEKAVTGKKPNARMSNMIGQCEELFKKGEGNKGETLWDLYNGVTEFFDHHRSLKNNENRWVSSMFGSGVETKERAFELAEAMLK